VRSNNSCFLAIALLAFLPAGHGQNIFVNIRTSGSTPSTSSIMPPAGFVYSAAAPVSGTTWNNVGRTVTVPGGTTVGSTSVLYSGLALYNSVGASIPQTLTVSYYSAVTTGSRTEPSTASGENIIQSGGVMFEAWRNYLNGSGNYFTFTISNLSISTPYGVYLYGGAGMGQSVGLTLPAGYALANSPVNSFTTNNTQNSSGAYGSLWTVSGGVANLMPQGTTWNTLYGKSDASGVFKFLFNGSSGYAYFNGFQIVPLSAPGMGGVTNQTIVAGNNAILNAVLTGLPVASLQWYSNNIAIPGATSPSLMLNNVQYTQNNSAYSLMATNIIGAATNSMTLTVIVTPSIAGLNNLAVSTGATVTMLATVSGVPAPATRWQFNGSNLSDGATGNGSTIAGSVTSTLVINNAQAADGGTYSLIASNTAGMVTNAITLTVSSGNVTPSITGPANQTVVQTSNALFNVSVSGLPIPTLQWRVNGADIAGATNSSLAVSNVQYAQNGSVYSLVASNSAGLATNSAQLFVLVPPVISQQPTNLSVVVNSSAAFNVTASGVPAVAYQWNKNGIPIANATSATYTDANALGNDAGTYSVTVSNSVGMVTSSNATLWVLSATLTGALLPTNGAVNISPDQQLRIVFSGSTPKLAYNGTKLYVRDAADNSLFATIDTSLFQTFTTDSATVSNAFVRTEQGNNFFYMPIAIYGNEAWITLNPTNRFAYGKTYYVTCDTGLFLDSANASFPAVTGTNTWRFSTKSVGPTTLTASTGPTNLTVGLDGAGDFATLQGASDWIPQNNTLKRTITIQPGTYHDFDIFTQNRSFVTVIGAGANRQAVQIIYPNAAYTSGSSCGMLRVESSDLYFRNLTLDNQVYLTNSLDNYGPWAGRLNTLDTTGSRLIFDNVIIKGGQDTLYTISGSAYFNRSEVWGSTDFIYGGALAVFDQCNIVEIKSSGGPCTAPSTPYAQPYNLVFLNCNFPLALVANGYPYDVGSASTTFMRPWGQDGMTAIINCAVGSQITALGWGVFGSGTETTCRAREFGTTLIGGGTASLATRAYWVNTIDPDYTSNPSLSPTDPLLAVPTGTNNRVAVTINANDYTLSSIFGNSYFNLNGWLPTVIPTITSNPTNQSLGIGVTATFAVTAIGIPSPSFQWLKNGAKLVNQTNATLTITGIQAGDVATYSVVASNSAGSVVSGNAVLAVTNSVPSINANNIIVVTDAAYGAVGDSVFTNTTAIQNAINAAALGGITNGSSGGTVEIPAGVFLCGPLTMKSCVNLQIDAGATLQMLPYGSYPGGTSPTDFISASKLHDIEISGSGTIDGQGADWWATNNATPGGINRPKAMFAPSTCTNILVRDVTLQNPPNTHISFRSICVNVTVDHININTPSPSPNTDGIDCSGVNVLIANSHISDGDDMIAMGDGHVGAFNYSFTITNCLFGNGHGVSIGSYTSGGLSNLLVINCTWTNGTSGFHLKADDDRGGVVQNIRLINLAMTNTQIPIFLYSYYTNSGTSSGASVAQAAAYPAFPVSSTTPIWRNIYISNLTAVAASGFPAGIIWGKPELSFSNVVMDHVNITASKYFQLYNAQGVQLIDSQITVAATNSIALYNADLIISNRGPAANLVKLEGITTNGYGNSLAFYNAQVSLRNTNALDDGPLTLAASTLTVSNNLALTPSAVYNFSVGTNIAQVAVKGNLQLGGNINISAGNGFTNGTYTLMTYTGTMNGNLPALGATPSGFISTLSSATANQINLIVSQVPGIPVNLTAVGSNLLIRLNWYASANAAGYNLKRSMTNGGAYSIIANIITTNYSDPTVNPGANYYYVVSATNSAGESGNSTQASAVPLPSQVLTNLNYQASGSQLQLWWPSDHLGWHLEAQTNSLNLGLATNWSPVIGSGATNQMSFPFGFSSGSVFFRLAYP
jgi:pectin methylesterase-like acyl-CoA thioesterase